MSARHVSSSVDPRRLSMLSHQIARQHPGRRQHIHGKLVGLPDRRDPTAKWFIVPALIVGGFFVLQLLRWFV